MRDFSSETLSLVEKRLSFVLGGPRSPKARAINRRHIFQTHSVVCASLDLNYLLVLEDTSNVWPGLTPSDLTKNPTIN